MAVLDWVFVAVLLFSMVLGAWRGLVYEILSVVSWIAAFVLAQMFAPDAAHYLSMYLPLHGASETVQYAAGFAVVFIVCAFVGGMLAFLVSKLVAAMGLAPVDRLLGAGFGAVRGVVLLLAATVVVGMTPMHTQALWTEATGPHIASAALKGLKPLMPQEFGKYLPSEV
jgi:membrane protein required for colicin V production